MTATTNRCVRLRAYPQGVPVASDFEAGDAPMPAAGDGQLLVRNIYLSLDPFLRGVISGRQIYADRVGPGDIMPGNTVGQVLVSHHDHYAAGDYVQVSGGWQAYCAVDADGARKLDPATAPLSTAVGMMGMPGLTAYAGLLHTAEPEPGDTVVVSAAAGPVGSTVGQIARIKGCRVVGIAGSDQKCRFVVDELGFDACINYKTQDLKAALADACPDRVNVYFDNVGGSTLEAVLANLAIGARVTLCGLISQYNADTPPPGPNLGPVIGARAILKGFVVYDHYHRWDEFLEVCGGWLRDGKLRYREDRSTGLDSAPEAFSRLMRGENFGKVLVEVAPETV